MAYPGVANVTVKKKTKLPLILGLVAVVLLLGAGGCVALVLGATERVADEARKIDARPVFPGKSDNAPPTVAGGGSGGTRDAPLPVGTEIDLGNGWRVTVVSADLGPGAGEAVAAASQFNNPPENGMRYIVVNISASFVGRPDASTESPFFGVDYSVFGSANVERSTFDSSAIAPEPALDSLAELAAGGVASGNLVLQVGADETALTLRLKPSMTFDASEAWVSLG